MAKKYGEFLVIEGSQLKARVPKNGIGYVTEFDPHMTYIINLITKKVVGSYAQEDLAHKCADFLNKADQLKLSKEIDKLLNGKQDL